MGFKKLLESYFLSRNTLLNFLRIAVFFLASFNVVQAQTVTITPDRDGVEGGQTGRFLVSIAPYSGGGGEIDILYEIVASSTAVPGVDFAGISGELEDVDYSFLFGGSGFIVINVIDELVVDGDKQLTIRLLPDDDYSLGASTEATITLFDNDVCPTITTTTPGNRCGPGTVNLSATAADGTVEWYSSMDDVIPLGTGDNFVTPEITSNTTYYAQAVSNVTGCPSVVRTPVVATVNSLPTITGTTPGSRCGPGQVTLGATANEGTINWYNTATSNPILGSGNSFTSGNIATSRNYFVAVTLNGCTSERQAVAATINPIPTITGTTPASRCGTGSLTLGASASSGTINWFATATGGVTLFSGTSFTTPELTTTTTYYAEASANDCTSAARTAVTATVNIQPSAGTPSNTTACSVPANGTTTIDLDNLLTGAGPGNWAYTSGPQGNVPINGQNVVNFNNRPDGNYVFTFTTTGAVAPCVNASSSVTISVSDCAAPCDAGNAAPVLNTAVPTVFCDVLSQELNAYTTGTAPSGTVLRWSTNSDPLVVNAHLTNTLVTTPGSYFAFFFDQANNCASPVLTVNLQRNTTPTINSTTPGSNCGAGSVVLSATASTGASLRWFDTLTSTQVLAVGANFTTPSITETRDYFVEATANGCTSARVAVTASVSPPFAGTPTNGSACSVAGSGGPTSIDLDSMLTGAEPGIWEITTDPSGNLVLGDGNIVDFLGLPEGDYIFTYTTNTAVAPCVNDSVAVIISVTDCLAPIDIAITKIANRNRAQVGNEIIFTISATLIEGERALDIIIEEIIPSGFTFISSNASIGTYDETDGFWEIPELLASAAANLTLIVSILDEGNYQNTVRLLNSTPIDSNPQNNQASVTIQVDKRTNNECGFLFNQFSPNDDGINDSLTINCIQDYPNNSLEVFDRYGNSVYQKTRYDNSWRGTGKNGDLPKGTYFYILDLGDGTEATKGWIQIIR